jgi:GT2 family glycosyltransferase
MRQPRSEPRHVAVADLDAAVVERHPSDVARHQISGALVLVRRGGAPVGTASIDPERSRDDDALLAAVRNDSFEAFAGTAPIDEAAASASVTVVIPSRDGARKLRRTLPSILALHHPDAAFLVVDNAPEDDSTHDLVAELAVNHPNLRYIVEPVAGLSRARNRGLDEVRTELVAFLDDDIAPEPDYLVFLTAPFAGRPAVWCTTGLVLPDRLDTPAQQLFEQFGGFGAGTVRREFRASDPNPPSPLFPFEPGLYGTGGSLAFRTAELRRLGGFDRRLGAGTPARGGEDLDITMRVIRRGGALVYEPRAVCWHPHHADYEHLVGQVEDYGAGLTAAFTKLLLQPTTAPAVVRRLPRGVMRLVSPTSDKNAKRGANYPRQLVRRELRGIAVGWVGYLRSLAITPAPRTATPAHD